MAFTLRSGGRHGAHVDVAAVATALVDPASFDVQLERTDMQQRLRVAAGAVYKDLVMVGAGAYQGANRGSLSYYFAPILPYRQGTAHMIRSGPHEVRPAWRQAYLIMDFEPIIRLPYV